MTATAMPKPAVNKDRNQPYWIVAPGCCVFWLRIC